MEAISTDRKTFQLTESGQLLGELIYENIFLLKAELKFPDSPVCRIRPKGIFRTSFLVTKNNTEIAKLKMNWQGQITFSFDSGEEFTLKAKGVFQSNFILENKEGEQLIQLDPKFSWKKFNYNYSITCCQGAQDILLTLLGVYGANYFIASMSGATSGIA